jgi:hypothetical protein
MILLDTHVLLWWRAGGERLSTAAARAIARADTVLVSPISCSAEQHHGPPSPVTVGRRPTQFNEPHRRQPCSAALPAGQSSTVA